MISLIEALNFRCLEYIRQPLDRFHVLVGPNASGKSTFLDVVSFLGDILEHGLEAAILERTGDFRDLVWQRRDECPVELAVEAIIPTHLRGRLKNEAHTTVRYEMTIGPDPASKEVAILSETALLKPETARPVPQRTLFPESLNVPDTIVGLHKGQHNTRTIVNKNPGGNDNFYSEVLQEGGKGWMPSFKLGPKRSSLANLPEDESRFPVCTWLKTLLTTGVQKIVLNSVFMRRASPPSAKLIFKPDGSNLPWVVDRLFCGSRRDYDCWIEHVRTALPDLRQVSTVEREDDRHRYLVLEYETGLHVPSWVASDGTLRLLALTLPAYTKAPPGIYLIEEPENGIHPRAVETVVQSLSSVYDAQILLATHSAVVLSTIDPAKILCFAKSPRGASDIVRGSDHPILKDWRGEENLGVLFAAGILG